MKYIVLLGICFSLIFFIIRCVLWYRQNIKESTCECTLDIDETHTQYTVPFTYRSLRRHYFIAYVHIRIQSDTPQGMLTLSIQHKDTTFVSITLDNTGDVQFSHMYIIHENIRPDEQHITISGTHQQHLTLSGKHYIKPCIQFASFII